MVHLIWVYCFWGGKGTGKDLFARAIHKFSGREGKFVVVNCGALPKDLLESELFGHSKGAFTGAYREKRGLFEEADKGTIFLDEIGCMLFESQSKLLRVIEESKIRRVGDTKDREVDVRIVCATNRDLKEAMESGEFRRDLYDRIAEYEIKAPRLSDRADDIPALCCYFFEKYRKEEHTKYIFNVSEKTFSSLVSMSDFDNIRSLEHLIGRLVVWLKSHCQPGIPTIKQFLSGNETYGISDKRGVFTFDQDKRSLLKIHIQFDHHWKTTARKYYENINKSQTVKKKIFSIYLNVGYKFKFETDKIAEYFIEEEIFEQKQKGKFLTHLEKGYSEIVDHFPEEDPRKRLYYKLDIPCIEGLIKSRTAIP